MTLSLKLKKKVEYFQTKNNTGNTKNTYWLWHMKLSLMILTEL